jgi:hypothetical protein
MEIRASYESRGMNLSELARILRGISGVEKCTLANSNEETASYDLTLEDNTQLMNFHTVPQKKGYLCYRVKNRGAE